MVNGFAECFTSLEDDDDDEIDCYFPSLQNPALLRELFAEGLITRAALAKGMGPIFNLEQIDIIQDVEETKAVLDDQEKEVEDEEDWKVRPRDKDDIKAEKEAAAKAGKKIADDHQKRGQKQKQKYRDGDRKAKKVAKRPAKKRAANNESSSSSSSDDDDENDEAPKPKNKPRKVTGKA
jgi:hypothetical protein